MKISYNWLKSYVTDMPEANKLADLFTYHVCEVESVEKKESGDFLFDLGILPNRAHDLLSHQGVAKELCGLLGTKYKDPSAMYKTPVSNPTKLSIEIQTKGCRRYSARIIRNVTVAPSQEWMVNYLESIGQRSINNVVDATNIVMYDKGQPCHAFDLNKITDYQLQITNAKEGEKLKLVGKEGAEVTLKESDVVISNNGKTLALAGVKGGFDSGVSSETTDILIEVANFEPTSTRKTARRLGLLSDAAKRFENDLSPELAESAMFDLSALLLEFFPNATFEDVVDVYPAKQENKTLSFTQAYIQKMIGLEISEKDIDDILARYEYSYKKEGDTYRVDVPVLRLDLIGPHDMAEEIGRIYGYDKVVPVLPKNDFLPKENTAYSQIVSVRDALTSAGYKEVMTYGFANTGDVEVLASASDKRFLRTNLSDGLKKSYEMNKLNAPLLGLSEIRIFEIGTIFKGGKEEIHVAYVNKKEVKELSVPEFLNSQINLPVMENLSKDSANRTFSQWSAYPFITRDIAVWVPEGTKPEMLAEIYKEFGAEILRGEPTLFDQFTKEGRTSYAFRLIFQSFDRTLTDDEISVIMSHITEKLSSLSFEIR